MQYKWHYVRDGKTLCDAIGSGIYPPYLPGETAPDPVCKLCLGRRRKELAKAKK
jgi:hypothetical protein